MTRNRDLDCEDLFGCDHEPEVPITEGGVILYWMCRCGKKHPVIDKDLNPVTPKGPSSEGSEEPE